MSGGTHRCMVGKNGLIEVNLIPTLEGERILQFRERKLPSDLFSGWENDCLWLGLKHKEWKM